MKKTNSGKSEKKYSVTIEELMKRLQDYSDKHPENYGADHNSEDYKAGYVHAINDILFVFA